MSAPPAKITVLAGERFACVKINGRASFQCSLDFKTVLHELLANGYAYFVLDLSECLLMDSTFLGVLAGFGLKLSGGKPEADNRAIELLNPNDRVTELLDSLGVLQLFRVTHGPLSLPDGVRAQETLSCAATKEETTRACLEAHQTLMSLNPDNVARFKDLTRFLAEDLKKMRH